jgi:hypothetical protein
VRAFTKGPAAASNGGPGRAGGRIRRGPLLFLGVLAIAMIASLGVASALADAPPTLLVNAPTEASFTSAHVSGSINPNGGPSTNFWSFEYSNEPANPTSWISGPGGQIAPPASEEATAVPVEGVLENLQPATEYSVRLGDFNEGFANHTVSDPPFQTFSTEPVGKPTVVIAAPGAVTGSSAHFSGTINPQAPAGDPPAFNVNWHFECNPGCAGLTGTISADSTSHTVEADATGLKPNTAYEVSLVATNAGGSETAGPQSFHTNAIGPAVETMPGFAFGSGTEALLGGRVNPENSPTTYWIEYGTDTGYGRSAPASQDAEAGEGGSATIVVQRIAGLTPGTTYHFRLVAENGVGTVEGEDMTLTTPPSSPPATECHNPTPRTGASASLPECRAYEMVSPPQKNGGDIGSLTGEAAHYNQEGGMQAAPGGDAIIYHSPAAFAGAVSGSTNLTYRAVRGVEGWSTVPISPSANSGIGFPTQLLVAASEDLSSYLEGDIPGSTGAEFATAPNNLFLVPGGGAPQLVTPGEPDGFGLNAHFGGGSQDLGRVVFTDPTVLVEGASPTASTGNVEGNLYGYSDGHLRLLGVLETGEAPALGTAIGRDLVSGVGFLNHAVSEDASTVFFTSLDDQQIYVRENAFGSSPTTTEVSVSEGGADPTGAFPSSFLGASATGSTAFFMSSGELTPDANTGASHGGSDLYEYRVGHGLTDLTVDDNPGDPDGADVLGATGVSDDGSIVYFVATGELVPGHGASGHPNLYVYRRGEGVEFIGTLAASGDESLWLGEGNGPRAELTPDGTHAVFLSRGRLTSFNNENAATEPTTQVYEYTIGSGLVCVSCNPDGSAGGSATIPSLGGGGGGTTAGNLAAHMPRYISDDGHTVFFDSEDSLVSGDTNGKYDVYRYSDGRPALVSTGRSPDVSEFIDSSTNGADAFFLTRERLSGEDVDNNMDLYDARVDGRSVAATASGTGCQGEACRGPAAEPPGSPPSASVRLTGAGNLAQGKSAKITGAKANSKGSAVVLTVKAPAAGQISVAGGQLKTTRQTVAKAGSYRLTVGLTGAAKRQLKKQGQLKVKVNLTFTGDGAQAKKTTATSTLKA